MRIIQYRRWDDIDIQFLDAHNFVKEHVTYSNFKRGEIKNPYDKILYGIGYIGVGKWKSRYGNKISDVYLSWMHMLERCYDPKEKNKYPAYYNKRTVCEEWYNYQTFADWYDKKKYQVNEKLHLDKDIKFPGNSIYSPDTCLLVPQRINMLFLNKPNKRGLPNGISKCENGYSAKYNGKKLGVYRTLEEAYLKYASAKKKEIVKIANEYQEIIPDEVYQALLDYKVLLKNDKNYLI